METRGFENDGSVITPGASKVRRRRRTISSSSSGSGSGKFDIDTEEHLADQFEHVRERAQEFLERELLFGVDEDKWAVREQRLRHALSPKADREQRAAVFVTIRSSSIVAIGMVLALCTIGSTIACSLIWSCTEEQRLQAGLHNLSSVKALQFLADPYCADLQGLVYPYISETARDMPQTGFFAFGMTVSVMMMVCCAVLQYGKVKREIRISGSGGGGGGGRASANAAGDDDDDGDNDRHNLEPHTPHIPVGAKRNFVALICGLVAPPFLGLLACYDTRRALNTHRVCVVIFFTLTIVYMFTMLSIYSYLAQIDDDPAFGGPTPASSPHPSSSSGGRRRAQSAFRRSISRVSSSRSLGGRGRGGDGRGDGAEGGVGGSDDDDGVVHADGLRGFGRLQHVDKPDVHFSLRLKTYIASTFTVLTTFYLPVGFMYVRACVRACLLVCVRASVRPCVRARLLKRFTCFRGILSIQRVATWSG